MKVRSDFVTNSSSSSFILAFNNNDKWSSYEDFRETCMFDNYEEFYNLIEDLKKDPENIDKEKALELLYNCYSWEYKFELLNSLINDEDYETVNDCYKARNELEKTEEFKEKVKNHTEQLPEYQKKKKQIEEADLVVQGMIWDTSGGLLEWSIRNGFIEDNFCSNHVLTWNVG